MATAKEIQTAKEVLSGKWGNGDTRKAKLTSAGYNYNVIQSLVNRLAKGENITPEPEKTETVVKVDDTQKLLKQCLSDIEKLDSFKKLLEKVV